MSRARSSNSRSVVVTASSNPSGTETFTDSVRTTRSSFNYRRPSEIVPHVRPPQRVVLRQRMHRSKPRTSRSRLSSAVCRRHETQLRHVSPISATGPPPSQPSAWHELSKRCVPPIGPAVYDPEAAPPRTDTGLPGSGTAKRRGTARRRESRIRVGKRECCSLAAGCSCTARGRSVPPGILA